MISFRYGSRQCAEKGISPVRELVLRLMWVKEEQLQTTASGMLPVRLLPYIEVGYAFQKT